MLELIRPRDLGFMAFAIALRPILDCGVKAIALNPAPRSYLNQEGNIRNAAESTDSKNKDKESLIDRGIYEEVGFSLAGCRPQVILMGFCSGDNDESYLPGVSFNHFLSSPRGALRGVNDDNQLS